MRIQLDWLKEYVDFDPMPAEALGDMLSLGGLEVENLEEVALPDGTKTPVMELNVTPNRGYCLSYLGVAREVAAFLDKEFRPPSPEAELEKNWGPGAVEEKLAVDNQEPVLCPRYAGMVIENVTPGPSPKWLADRLVAVGLRPINNIVDITNFVLLETGQPLHAFDRDRLAEGRIVVRRARPGEAFSAIDGSELKLESDALVIADAEKPVALAGIMGGANSQVTGATRHVVLESACFDLVTVRKGSKKYNIRSDSSYRFERGIDIDGVTRAQARAALLIRELAGGEIRQGRVDIYPAPQAPRVVTLRVARTNQVLGSRLSAWQIAGYLRRLGLSLAPGDEPYKVGIPGFRPDLTREIDLIEEIARLHGFDRVEVRSPHAEILPVPVTPHQVTARKTRDLLAHGGYAEAINYSFIDSGLAEAFKIAFAGPDIETISLSNPLSNEWGTMRPSLMPGLLKTAQRNLSKGQKPVKVFELGTVFLRGADRSVEEKSALGVLVVGKYENSVWKATGKNYDFYDLKGALETLSRGLGVEFEARPATRPFLHPDRAMSLFIDGWDAGYLGELSPGAARQWDLGEPCCLLEIDFDRLILALPPPGRFQPIPKFPETYRDISVLVDKAVPAGRVTDLILKTGGPFIRRVDLYDHFEGGKIGPGKKSLTFSLVFQSPEKTLSDDEVNPVFGAIVGALADELGAGLRE